MVEQAPGDGRRVWNVLIVDDEADLRTLVTLTLGFEDDLAVVATAATAGEAIVRADETEPDVVILDHMLGGPVTGLQVADQLRETHPSTRVILFSAAKDVIDLREHPVDAVVSKMDIGDLPGIIQRVLAAPLT
jgi:DNA-binding NarL/FixJ family response regulator